MRDHIETRQAHVGGFQDMSIYRPNQVVPAMMVESERLHDTRSQRCSPSFLCSPPWLAATSHHESGNRANYESRHVCRGWIMFLRSFCFPICRHERLRAPHRTALGPLKQLVPSERTTALLIRLRFLKSLKRFHAISPEPMPEPCLWHPFVQEGELRLHLLYSAVDCFYHHLIP